MYIVISDLQDGGLRVWVRDDLAGAMHVYVLQMIFDMQNWDKSEPLPEFNHYMPSAADLADMLHKHEILEAYNYARAWYEAVVILGDGRCQISGKVNTNHVAGWEF